MSGTFNDISVPPTLITFAVTTEKTEHIISPEFKEAGHHIYYIKHTPNDNQTPNYEELKANFAKAVSYTHLDVYKRQGTQCDCHTGGDRGSSDHHAGNTG